MGAGAQGAGHQLTPKPSPCLQQAAPPAAHLGNVAGSKV